MKRALVVVGVIALAGCVNLGDLLPRTTTVRLVNDGDFDVEVTIAISDEQDIPEDLLTELGTELSFTLGPGEATSFSRNCDDLQAIIVEDAELKVIGQVGPHTSSTVLRDGSQFFCRDTITFTFTHSALIVDFDVSTAVD